MPNQNQKKGSEAMGKKGSRVRVRSLEDLINLNLSTLEDVVTGEIDNKKAALIFTGSRTVASSMKLGIEAMKLGMVRVAGVEVGGNDRLIETE